MYSEPPVLKKILWMRERIHRVLSFSKMESLMVCGTKQLFGNGIELKSIPKQKEILDRNF
jgi:hypothetical protein